MCPKCYSRETVPDKKEYFLLATTYFKCLKCGHEF